MRCSEFRVRLDQLLDNRLDPEMDWNLTSHAEQCEACRDELSGQQLLSEAMDLLDVPDLSDSFAEEVAAASARQPRPAAVRSSRSWWIAGIAVAASLLVGFNLMNPASRQQDSRDQLSRMPNDSVQATADLPAESSEQNPAADVADKAKAGEPKAEAASPVSIIPSGYELFSFQNIDSDEIPGIRPLKTSFDITISLLKQTIPGRNSPQPKQPTTSQVFHQQWCAV